jgi:hypothetical protein
MTVVRRVSTLEMINETGLNALGYAFPKRDLILIRDDLDKDLGHRVLQHEVDHILNGEEGPWIMLAAAAASALASASAAKKGSEAVAEGAGSSAQVQWDMYEKSRKDMAPWRRAGNLALTQYSDMLGLAPKVPEKPKRKSFITRKEEDDGGTDWKDPLGQKAGVDLKPTHKIGGKYDKKIASNEVFDKYGYKRALAKYDMQVKDYNERYGLLTPLQEKELATASSTSPADQGRLEYLRGIKDAGPKKFNAESVLQNTPGYEWRMDQGEKTVQRGLASQRGILSGAAAKELTRYGQGFASQEFDGYMNKLAALSGLGQTATQQTAAIGQSTASNVGNAYMTAGAARNAGHEGVANSVNAGAGNMLFSQYSKNRIPAPGGSTVDGSYDPYQYN